MKKRAWQSLNDRQLRRFKRQRPAMAAFLYLWFVVSSQWSVVISLSFVVDDSKVGTNTKESLCD
jgi:hypothetical protein